MKAGTRFRWSGACHAYRKIGLLAANGGEGSLCSTLNFSARLKSVSSSSLPESSSAAAGAVSENAARDGSETAYMPGSSVHVEYPIVQLPARSLWCKQYSLDPSHVSRGDFADMIARVQAARHHYQYPSLCAPQIGWNVQMFTLFDGTVFINPVNLDALELEEKAKRSGVLLSEAEAQWMAQLRQERKTCFAWEPCASCCFLLHYIERPTTVRLRAIGGDGRPFEVTLDMMRARMALHEMDHLNGILFTRRIPDTNHVVPLEGFSTMSDWSDDYPSLEARSTYLYTTFTPPYSFITDNVEDAQMLDRKFEDGIYPGCEHDRRMRIESAAFEELQRARWRMEKKRHEKDEEEEGEGEDDDDDNTVEREKDTPRAE